MEALSRLKISGHHQCEIKNILHPNQNAKSLSTGLPLPSHSFYREQSLVTLNLTLATTFIVFWSNNVCIKWNPPFLTLVIEKAENSTSKYARNVDLGKDLHGYMKVKFYCHVQILLNILNFPFFRLQRSKNGIPRIQVQHWISIEKLLQKWPYPQRFYLGKYSLAIEKIAFKFVLN